MTVDKDFKRLVRERSERTGESYAAARRSLLAKAGTAETDVVHDMWFTRATHGYSGKGARPTGYEHHVVSITGSGLRITSAGAMKNYGIHRYSVEADAGTCSSTYEYNDGAVVINARRRAEAWTGDVAADGDAATFEIALADPALAVPNLVSRFLGLGAQPAAGDVAEYVPVPEDGFPAWRPGGGASWFPLMGVSRDSLIVRRVVRGVGEEMLKQGRKSEPAFRFDHVADGGKVVASMWVGEDMNVLRFERPGCVLVAVTEDEALRYAP